MRDQSALRELAEDPTSRKKFLRMGGSGIAASFGRVHRRLRLQRRRPGPFDLPLEMADVLTAVKPFVKA